MQAAVPHPDPAPQERPALHLLPPPPENERARSATPPSRVQALILLLVLPLALIATAVIIRPPRSAAPPEVLVVGSTAGTRWAHDALDDLGPVVLSSSRSAPATVTEIHYRGGGARAQAEAVRRTLGRGTLIDAPALEQSFPVVVYLGRDTPAQ